MNTKRRRIIRLVLSILIFVSLHVFEILKFLHLRKKRVITSRDTKYQFVDKSQNFSQSQICRAIRSKANNLTWEMERSYLINDGLSVGYCRIAKCGSTYITALLKKDTSSSNTSISSLNKYTKMRYINRTKIEKTDILRKMSFRFAFVKNPYARIWSGYADKFVGPNYEYWTSLGVYIKKNFGEQNTDNNTQNIKCGHNVTFRELFRYVLHSQRTEIRRDAHFYSMFDHCQPCTYPLHFVGKAENFSSELKRLLIALSPLQNVSGLRQEGRREIVIKAKIKRLYRERQQIQLCMPFYEAMIRVWTYFKVKGFIPAHQAFPYLDKDALIITMEEFQQKALSLQTTKTDHHEMTMLKIAYSNLPWSWILEFVELYQSDFKFFNYEPFPGYIFRHK